MTRSPEQVLKAHFDALQNGDVQALVADYADDAAIITAQGVMAGHSGIEASFTGALQVLPEARFALSNVVHHEEVALLNWTAIWPAGRIDDGWTLSSSRRFDPRSNCELHGRTCVERQAGRFLARGVAPTARIRHHRRASAFPSAVSDSR
jgi:ketosteroid isomerase-like protein